jgi:hypothetical protein
MKLYEVFSYIVNHLIEIKDALIGSLIYSIYNHVNKGKPVGKNVASFFMGSIFAIYVSPFLFEIAQPFKLPFALISFLSGLLGMEVMTILLDMDWKNLITILVNWKFKRK